VSAKRYFEFIEGTSSKFWEIWRDGSQVYTRYGKIGANGQVTVKDEGDDGKAEKLYDKLVREKTGKGYVEKAAAGGVAAPAKPAPAKAAPAPKKAAAVKAPVVDEEEEEEEEKPAPKKAAPAAVPAGTRRFEFAEGGSNKFWEITVDGSAHTVRFGKIGTPGQEKTKSFGSDGAAQADADKLIAEKTKKGYAEVGAPGGGDAGPPPPELDEAELDHHLAAVDADPDAIEPRLVFGDWLQSKGHPWGTLIALNHAIATAPNEKKRAELQKEETALLQSQGSAILGELARAGRPTRFTWHYGFIDEAVIASAADKLVLKERLSTLFALPAARRLKKLTLHAQPARLRPHSDWDDSPDDIVDPWKDAIPALAGAPATLKALALGDPPPTGASAYVATPDLGRVQKVLPKLESLEVQASGAGGLGKFAFAELRALEVRLARANADDLNAIRDAKLPKIERLSVWLGGHAYCCLDEIYEPDWDADDDDGGSRYPEHYPSTDLEKMDLPEVESDVGPDALRAFLSAKWPASLKTLGLKSGALSADHVEAICAAPILAQLETLDLSGGTLREADAEVLVKRKAKLAHLKSLDLSSNGLSKELATKIKAALKNADCGKQRDEGYAPEFLFRYVATME
jgi:uncharacterized protein (TIGR02996 family)